MALSLIVGLLFLAATIAVRQYYRTRTVDWKTSFECKPVKRFPHIDPIFGLDLLFVTAIKLIQNRHITAVANRHKKYGHTFAITNVGYTTFHTMHPENIEAVFGKRWEDWPVAPARESTMEPFSGRGFITTDGEEWRRFRTMIDPSFSDDNVSDLTSLDEAFDEFLDSLPSDGTTIDLAPIFSELFLDLTGDFLLRKRFSKVQTQETKDSSMIPPQDFLQAFHAGGFWVGVRITFGWLGINCPNPSFWHNCRTVHRFVDHYVNMALESAKTPIKQGSLEASRMVPKAASQSFVSSLVLQSSNSYEIRSQLLHVMLASQDTVSTLLSNCVFLVSRHAKVWSRLREEVNALGTQPLTADLLEKLQYLQNIIRESLRLYPVFGQMGRTAGRDTVLPKGGGEDGQSPVFVPSNCRIIASFHALHRQTTVFGPDVECFDPDRWNSIEPRAWEYLPFLNGPRSCPGRKQTMIQVSFCLARLAQQVSRIESRDHRDWAGEWKLIVKNAHGCKVAIYRDIR